MSVLSASDLDGIDVLQEKLWLLLFIAKFDLNVA
jgi:hypothetical protein